MRNKHYYILAAFMVLVIPGSIWALIYASFSYPTVPSRCVDAAINWTLPSPGPASFEQLSVLPKVTSVYTLGSDSTMDNECYKGFTYSPRVWRVMLSDLKQLAGERSEIVETINFTFNLDEKPESLIYLPETVHWPALLEEYRLAENLYMIVKIDIIYVRGIPEEELMGREPPPRIMYESAMLNGQELDMSHLDIYTYNSSGELLRIGGDITMERLGKTMFATSVREGENSYIARLVLKVPESLLALEAAPNGWIDVIVTTNIYVWHTTYERFVLLDKYMNSLMLVEVGAFLFGTAIIKARRARVEA